MQGASIVIIGAGPAGLTAGYLLSKQGVPVTILESDPVYVGGIARTVRYKGYRFDIGGHRFFSKSEEVEALWTEILPDDMLDRPRSSRILYNGELFTYPLRAFDALRKLGVVESARCVLSYLHACVFPVRNATTFEDWVSNQFGKRLFSIFFKTYTEKVWGMSCKDISADWAAQRIKGLSLKTAILNSLLPATPRKARSEVVKTLIETFRYPRLGPGMMWETCAERIGAAGGAIHLGMRVVGCEYDRARDRWTVVGEDAQKTRHAFPADHVISSAPIRELVNAITPALPQEAVDAANALKYRDFVTVALMLRDRDTFADNWIYIHDPKVQVGRIQNFKAWSPDMVPEPGMTCYGLEYFCFRGDDLWTSSDEALRALAARELVQIGLARGDDIVDGCVVRQAKAYPVYDDDYAAHVDTVRGAIERGYPRLHLVGRNGMHKYNNQDHAMMTAMLCVRNILAGKAIYDLWGVNQDAEYHESGSAGGQNGAAGLRQVPTRVSSRL